jgi:hypothetical protein
MNNGAKKNAQPAFKELVENTSRYNGTQESDSISQVTKEQFGTFKFYTIFTDETYDYLEDTTTTPLEGFLQRNTEFLEKNADVARNSLNKMFRCIVVIFLFRH